MAQRLVTIIAGGMVIGLILGPIAAVLMLADTMPALRSADMQALRFTVVQALMSAGLSVGLAIPVARALARQTFWGRSVLITVLGAPFILPVIVAVLGLLAVFGNSGWINDGLALLGLPRVSIYGLHGVVLAHVFFNLPLATRLVLLGWLSMPAERLRLADTLGLGPWQVMRVLEWPMLRQVVPSAFAVIFVICLSSFAVALTLGGGPKATTLELAIYQAVRFDFDLGRAALLAVVQLGLAGVAGLVALGLTHAPQFGLGRDRVVVRADARMWTIRVQDGLCIAVVAAFLLLPLGAVVGSGVMALPDLQAEVWRAAGYSLAVALGSTALCLVWALALAQRGGEWASLLGIAVSPLVLGIGLFLLIRPYANPTALALPVTAVLNALMALPFAVRVIRPVAEATRADYAPLCAAMGLSWRIWVMWVLLPRLRRPLGFSAGLTAALSMGDLGVIALFADPDRATLPLQVYRLMSAYRMDQAGAAALVLLMLSLGVFWLFDRGGRTGAAT
ncbi:MAG: thiamine/thiamine pyrophosphate ABC transporter permease ThiP [Paracoccaceae bacterium]